MNNEYKLGQDPKLQGLKSEDCTARAILAERERLARIASENREDDKLRRSGGWV